MINSLKSKISRNITNAKGWRTHRKIVVIESDDWGSIRMPNRIIYNNLLKKNIRVDLCPYNRYDTLASSKDFEELYEVLAKHKDQNNNPPIITLNTNTSNPDFDKIETSNFEKYFHKKFTDNLEEYYPNKNVFALWEQGMDNKFILPQLHGREHVNPVLWLELLNKGSIPLNIAFKYNMFGLSFITSDKIKTPFLASLIYNSNHGEQVVKKSIAEGAYLFEDIFGFKSKSFIAPLYTWPSKLSSTFKDAGIEFIQGGDKHMEYDFKIKKFVRTRHSLGSQDINGMMFLNRNCMFEPSINTHIDNIEQCLRQIKSAFFWNKPAVISMHRLNFIGTLIEENRIKNLALLDSLLLEIKRRWPEVEFMDSSKLGEFIKSNINYD